MARKCILCPAKVADDDPPMCSECCDFFDENIDNALRSDFELRTSDENQD